MKISVITVSYNAVDVIERTIQSVARQRYDDYEYIIVDGNSNDGTVDVIKRNQVFYIFLVDQVALISSASLVLDNLLSHNVYFLFEKQSVLINPFFLRSLQIQNH